MIFMVFLNIHLKIFFGMDYNKTTYTINLKQEQMSQNIFSFFFFAKKIILIFVKILKMKE